MNRYIIHTNGSFVCFSADRNHESLPITRRYEGGPDGQSKYRSGSGNGWGVCYNSWKVTSESDSNSGLWANMPDCYPLDHCLPMYVDILSLFFYPMYCLNYLSLPPLRPKLRWWVRRWGQVNRPLQLSLPRPLPPMTPMHRLPTPYIPHKAKWR